MRLKKVSGKGHKWKKGQSCVSNPGNSKFRDAAKGSFFQKLDGNSGLTQEAVAQHEAAYRSHSVTGGLRSVKSLAGSSVRAMGGTEGDTLVDGRTEGVTDELQRQMEELSVDEDDLKSAGKSFNTFATNITTCTIPAFEKFFRNFSQNSELHTRMLAIHAATQEYLKESNTPETSTSYFCGLLVSLDGISDSEADVAATLGLMAKVIRRVSPSVLCARFGIVTAKLDEALTRYQGSDNMTLLTNAMGSLSIVLRAQERSQWTFASTLNLLDKILAFTVHPKPKIRKAAQYNVTAILKASSFILEEKERMEEKMNEESEQKMIEDEENEGKMMEGDEESEGKMTQRQNKSTKMKKGKRMDDENEKKVMEDEGKMTEGKNRSTEIQKAVIHPAAGHVADFCLSQIRIASETDNKKTRLHLLVLLRQVIASFPRKKVKSACELMLSLLQLGGSLTNTCAMQALYSLLVTHPPSYILPLDTNAALLAALMGRGSSRGGSAGIIPGKNDPQSATAWITVVTIAIINLCKLSTDEGVEVVTLWIQQVISYWQSDHHDVHIKVFESIEAVLKECGIEYLNRDKYQPQISIILSTLSDTLSLQYQSAWGQVFSAIGVALEVIGPHYPTLAKPVLSSLCQLMANNDLPHRRPLEKAVGSGVAALGPQMLMEIVPLSITGDIKIDEPTLWTLPLIAKYIGTSGGSGGSMGSVPSSAGSVGSVPGSVTAPSLCYFVNYFVPRAAKFHQLATDLATKPAPAPLLSRTYKVVEGQIWTALPGWCKSANDLNEALKHESFARLLCEHIRSRRDTRLAIMEALRIMLSRQHPPELLKNYAKNYLPALFNIYLGGNNSTNNSGNSSKNSGNSHNSSGNSDETPSIGQRQAALLTVKTYLNIIDASMTHQLLGQVMKRYEDPSADLVRRQALLNLVRTFLPHLTQAQLSEIYNIAIKAVSRVEGKVKGGGGHKEQKAAYRLIEGLLSTETQEARDLVSGRLEELSETLAGGLGSAAPPSRAPRLRCLTHMLQQLPRGLATERREALMSQVVGESVMCCSPGSSRAARTAAFTLLATVGATIQRLDECSAGDTVRGGLKYLLAGLVGSASLASNSLLAITALTYQYKDVMPQDVLDKLVSRVCELLKCPSREITGSSLSFLKSSLIIFPPQVISPHVEKITKAICAMKDDCQRKFRLKTRDIFDRLMRKFGADYITSLVPKDGVIFKRLRNLRKAAARKQRARDAERDAQGDEDADEFTSRAMPASLDEILAEIDSEDEEEEKKEKKEKKKGGKVEAKKKNKNKMWIKEGDEEIVDLLDASAGQAIVSREGRKVKSVVRRNADSSGGFKVDKDSGKLIITDKKDRGGPADKEMDFSEDLDEFLGLKSGAAGGKMSQGGIKRARTISEGSAEVMQELSIPSSSKGKSGNTTSEKQKPPQKKKKRFEYGSEFRSKRAGGDMTGKSNMAPYAYVQLSKERLNKRKKAKYDGQFTSLVRGARKGVATGKRARMGKKITKKK